MRRPGRRSGPGACRGHGRFRVLHARGTRRTRARRRPTLPQLRRPYVLSVSGFDARKDPGTLLRAFARLPHALRVAPSARHRVRSPSRRTRRVGQARRPRMVSPSRTCCSRAASTTTSCAASIATPTCSRSPPAPKVSASRSSKPRCCGCPAVSSDAAAIPEVLAEPASTFPTGDAEALCALLARGLTDEAFRATLLAAAERASVATHVGRRRRSHAGRVRDRAGASRRASGTRPFGAAAARAGRTLPAVEVGRRRVQRTRGRRTPRGSRTSTASSKARSRPRLLRSPPRFAASPSAHSTARSARLVRRHHLHARQQLLPPPHAGVRTSPPGRGVAARRVARGALPHVVRPLPARRSADRSRAARAPGCGKRSSDAREGARPCSATTTGGGPRHIRRRACR